MGITDWIGDKWGEFVLARPWRKENREEIVNSPASPFKAENWKPREGFLTPTTPAQAIRNINDRAAGKKGDYFNAPAPAFDPAQSTRATQRYLSRVGWDGGYSPLSQSTEGFEGLEPVDRIGGHKYSLSPWQMEQAELDYGFEAPEDRVQLTGDTYNVSRMSQEAFDMLTPAQQRAIRFNQMLTEAVAADRAMEAPTDRGDYDARAVEMFGTQGVSHTYAPNTLALLEGLGMGRLRGQDLDEYLSLDRAYDVDELRSLPPEDAVGPQYSAEGFANARTRETANLLDRATLAKAGSLIDRARTETALPGWDEASRLRGLAGLPLAEGWRTSYRSRDEVQQDQTAGPVEQFSAFYWDEFRDRGLDTNEVLNQFWIDADREGLTEDQANEVFDILLQRSYVQPAGDDAYLSGEELRRALGMEV